MTSRRCPPPPRFRAASSAVATMGPYAATVTSVPSVSDAGAVQRHGSGRRVIVDVALLPVAALRLEEHDGVVRGDRLLDHPVAVGRVARRHDAQARGVGEVGLG